METLWGISYTIWFIVCMLIAVLYLFAIPKAALASAKNSMDRVILRYGHAAVWLLLAFACITAYFKNLFFAKIIALGGLLVYLIFIITLGKIKKIGRRD